MLTTEIFLFLLTFKAEIVERYKQNTEYLIISIIMINNSKCTNKDCEGSLMTWIYQV